MAYDDSPFRRRENMADQPRYQGQPGVAAETDLRFGGAHRAGTAYQTGQTGQTGQGYQVTQAYQAGQAYTQPGQSYQGGGFVAGGYGDEETRPSMAAAVPAAELNDAFDAADDGGGRDRLAVHWIWEVLLLIGVGVLGFLLWRADSGALRGDDLSLLLVQAAGFGLLGLAAGLTLRAGAPNLAIGPVAVAAGVYYAQHGADGVVSATVGALGTALVLGTAVAIVVIALHVPAWAVSLAAGAGAVVWLQLQPAEIELTGGYDPSGQAAFLFALVAALGILGGLLGTLKGVRNAVGRFRPVGNPAHWRGGLAALMTGSAILLSMVFATGAGVLLVAGYGQPIGPGQPVEGVSGVTWLTWTAIGFGVALVGGTSAYGRRGGVFGTILAVVALLLFQRYQAEQGWAIALLATAAVAVAGGLLVTRIVELFGGPREDDDSLGREWADGSDTVEPAGRRAEMTTATGMDGWPGSPAEAWSSALPSRPVAGNADPWDDDRWSRR